MHKRACEYAHALNLHKRDDDGLVEDPLTDADRVALWDLIQLDLFNRLVHNKTAAFPADLKTWRVNMPWMLETTPKEGEAVETTAFLARSRLTFILVNFFHSIEALENFSDAMAVILPLCNQSTLTPGPFHCYATPAVQCHLS